MIHSHKIEIKPNTEQKSQLVQSCGCARFAYNWGLSKWSEMYKQYKTDTTLPKPNANLIKKEFNKIKEIEFPWIYDSPKDANQQAFTNLGKAFNRFFKKISNYPKMKKKGKRDSFYISNDKFTIEEKTIKLPKIGNVKLTESLRFDGKINSCVISRKANKWFASISVEIEDIQKTRKSNNTIGIDFGLKTLITTNDGSQIQSPKPLHKYQNRLKMHQRRLSRRLKGSKNREKQKIKVAKLYMKITNIRNDFTHKLTTQLCNENQVIIIEDISVKSWMKKYGKSTSDNCIGNIIQQLSYKKDIYDNIIHKVDRWYPSSKTCSHCGHVKNDLSLSERTYKCESCGFTLDRDHNAAKNIYTAGLAGIYACGYKTSGSSSTTIKSSSRNKNLKIVKFCDKILTQSYT
jgi:putative transposase